MTGAGGAAAAGALPMLTKLQLLFSNMADAGARFEGEAQRILRPVREALRRVVSAAAHASGRAAEEALSDDRRRVSSVLAETVMA